MEEDVRKLFDYCNDIDSPNSISEAKALEFVSKEKWEKICDNMGAITLSYEDVDKFGKPKIPCRDVLHGITGNPLYWD